MIGHGIYQPPLWNLFNNINSSSTPAFPPRHTMHWIKVTANSEKLTSPGNVFVDFEVRGQTEFGIHPTIPIQRTRPPATYHSCPALTPDSESCTLISRLVIRDLQYTLRYSLKSRSYAVIHPHPTTQFTNVTNSGSEPNLRLPFRASTVQSSIVYWP